MWPWCVAIVYSFLHCDFSNYCVGCSRQVYFLIHQGFHWEARRFLKARAAITYLASTKSLAIVESLAVVKNLAAMESLMALRRS